MFGRATIFIGVLSGTIVALALLAQATRFGHETLVAATLLMPVTLYIGIATFIRSVAINYEDAVWLEGMNLRRNANLRIVAELEPFLRYRPRARRERGAARPRHAPTLGNVVAQRRRRSGGRDRRTIALVRTRAFNRWSVLYIPLSTRPRNT